MKITMLSSPFVLISFKKKKGWKRKLLLKSFVVEKEQKKEQLKKSILALFV